MQYNNKGVVEEVEVRGDYRIFVGKMPDGKYRYRVVKMITVDGVCVDSVGMGGGIANSPEHAQECLKTMYRLPPR